MTLNATNAAALPRLTTIRAGRGVVPHNIGFWLVAAAFASLQAFGTVPTPLWPPSRGRPPEFSPCSLSSPTLDWARRRCY
jgi:hypothetical protein